MSVNSRFSLPSAKTFSFFSGFFKSRTVAVFYPLVLITGLFLAVVFATPASAQQGPSQGWAGIVAGSNDYNNAVAYSSPQLACESFQNSFVPQFGYQVFRLLSVDAQGRQYNPATGVRAPATGCARASSSASAISWRRRPASARTSRRWARRARTGVSVRTCVRCRPPARSGRASPRRARGIRACPARSAACTAS